MTRIPTILTCFAAAALCACLTAAGAEQGRRPAGRSHLTGTWGGPHIRLEVTDQGAAAELDCAHGGITEPITLSRDGHFRAAGTFVREHGGPVREGEAEDAQPARWEGRVQGEAMKLTVTLSASGEVLGPFELVRGREARLTKCL